MCVNEATTFATTTVALHTHVIPISLVLADVEHSPDDRLL